METTPTDGQPTEQGSIDQGSIEQDYEVTDTYVVPAVPPLVAELDEEARVAQDERWTGDGGDGPGQAEPPSGPPVRAPVSLLDPHSSPDPMGGHPVD